MLHKKRGPPKWAPPKSPKTLLELANVGSLELAVLTSRDVELDSLALVQRLEAVHLDLGVVNEQVVPILAGDEAVALVRIEPLDSTLSHVVPFFLCPAGQKLRLRAIPVTIRPQRVSYPESSPSDSTIHWEAITSRWAKAAAYTPCAPARASFHVMIESTT